MLHVCATLRVTELPNVSAGTFAHLDNTEQHELGTVLAQTQPTAMRVTGAGTTAGPLGTKDNPLPENTPSALHSASISYIYYF